MDQPIFELENVTRRRERGGVVFELSVPVFRAERGRFVAVVGPSGCGKSTMLDLLAMVLKPTGADKYRFRPEPGLPEVDVFAAWESGSGAPLATLRKNHIGYVLQNGGLLPFLSSMENILLPCRLKGDNHGREYALEIARRLDIEPQLLKKPQFLSGGQRQRVAIARALAHRPAVVLADEPTAAVDSARAKDIFGQFFDLAAEQKVAMIVVTHDMTLIDRPGITRYTFEVKPFGENHTLATLLEDNQ